MQILEVFIIDRFRLYHTNTSNFLNVSAEKMVVLVDFYFAFMAKYDIYNGPGNTHTWVSSLA
jgi:hypothetical protein